MEHKWRISAMADAAANLMARVPDSSGLSVGLHPASSGIRITVQEGGIGQDAMKEMRRFADVLNVPLGKEVAYPDTSVTEVNGSWLGIPVTASHTKTKMDPATYLTSDSQASFHTGLRLAGRLSNMATSWLRMPWTKYCESVLVFDKSGRSCLHVALRSSGPLEAPIVELFAATGGTSRLHERLHHNVQHAEIVLETGTLITVSSVEESA